jgi:FkbM family methyltransferase
MSIINFLGKRINSRLRNYGYEIRTYSKYHVEFNMDAAVSRRAFNGLNINAVIDIGASNGSWSQNARKYFPEAFYLLIEANKIHENELIKFTSNNKNTDYILAAAGDSVGHIYFDVEDPFGGVASYSMDNFNYVTVPVTTIDHEVIVRGLSPPYCIKLDTHGFEVPILQGAIETLKNTHLLIIEVYNFKLNSKSLRFWEMCSFLENLGFLPIDLCDPLIRPKDSSLWQMDLFFIQNNSAEFQNNRYI